MNWKRLHREDGQSTVELALVMPVLLGFFILILDVGLLLFSYVSVTNAVREGARCAAVGGSEAAVEQRVADTGIVELVDVTVSDRSSSTIGDNVQVTATFSYDWIFPTGLIPGVDLATTEYTKSASMRLETDETSGNCPVAGTADE